MKENIWVKVLNFKNENLNYKGDNFFGYSYIDHEAGLTIDAIQFFNVENNSILLTENSIELNERTIIRFDSLSKQNVITKATEQEIQQYNLIVPDYLKIYNKPKLKVFREEKLFHEFRAPGYPDDVMILLPPFDGRQPEQVWLRVEEYTPENKMVEGILLNQPNQNFGVNKNERIIALYTPIANQPYLIADINFDKIPKKKKWQFWK